MTSNLVAELRDDALALDQSADWIVANKVPFSASRLSSAAITSRRAADAIERLTAKLAAAKAACVKAHEFHGAKNSELVAERDRLAAELEDRRHMFRASKEIIETHQLLEKDNARLRAALEDICDDSRFFSGTPNPVTVLRRIAREALGYGEAPSLAGDGK